MIIDPHVHCRDEEQEYKTTIAKVLELAKVQNINIIFDMPNTERPVTTRKRVLERLALVPQDQKHRYFLWIGATENPEQLEEAVRCYEEFDEVIGIKMFAGKSVGDLAIVKPEKQKMVYETLTKLGYEGVVATHCEREDYIDSNIFNPSNPATHSYSRPPIAEIEAVRDQIRFAKESGFRGTLHICHVSVPNSVELIDRARADIKITCGITPHHYLWSTEKIKNCDMGLLFKINPPLRTEQEVSRLREKLKVGKIDWIETDHAPHTFIEKLEPPHLSGYPSMNIYNHLVKAVLPQQGFTKDQIGSLTFGNIYRTFENKLRKIID